MRNYAGGFACGSHAMKMCGNALCSQSQCLGLGYPRWPSGGKTHTVGTFLNKRSLSHVPFHFFFHLPSHSRLYLITSVTRSPIHPSTHPPLLLSPSQFSMNLHISNQMRKREAPIKQLWFFFVVLFFPCVKLNQNGGARWMIFSRGAVKWRQQLFRRFTRPKCI